MKNWVNYLKVLMILLWLICAWKSYKYQTTGDDFYNKNTWVSCMVIDKQTRAYSAPSSGVSYMNLEYYYVVICRIKDRVIEITVNANVYYHCRAGQTLSFKISKFDMGIPEKENNIWFLCFLITLGFPFLIIWFFIWYSDNKEQLQPVYKIKPEDYG